MFRFVICMPDMKPFCEEVTGNFPPEKLGGKFTDCYNQFYDWRIRNGVDNHSENIFIDYFRHLIAVKKMNPSSLWAIYFMLRLTTANNDNVDISKFSKLRAMLRKENNGYVPKKSKVKFCFFFHFKEYNKILIHTVSGIIRYYKVF